MIVDFAWEEINCVIIQSKYGRFSVIKISSAKEKRKLNWSIASWPNQD